MINIAVSGAAGMISNHLLFKVRIHIKQPRYVLMFDEILLRLFH